MLLSLKNSIKFILMIISYCSYILILYFAITTSIKTLSLRKEEFSKCKKMFMFVTLFLCGYCVDTLRYVIYIVLSIFNHKFSSKIGIYMFLINMIMISYGILNFYSENNECLKEYEIKNYIVISTCGIICSFLTYLYHKFDYIFKNNLSNEINEETFYLIGNQ